MIFILFSCFVLMFGKMALLNWKPIFQIITILVVSVILVKSLKISDKSQSISNRIRRFSHSSELKTTNEDGKIDRALARLKRSVSDDMECVKIGTKFEVLEPLKNNFIKEALLTQDNKYSLQLAWTGPDYDKIILITSEEGNSTVYLSDENNLSFVDISSRVHDDITKEKDLTLLKHSNDTETVFLLSNTLFGETSTLHVSMDSAKTFQTVALPFKLTSALIYHSVEPKNILALDEGTKKLWLSRDKGLTWENIKTKVIHAKWSSYPGTAEKDDIFVVTNNESESYSYFYSIIGSATRKNNLEKMSNFDKNWRNIYPKEYVHTFGMEDKFLYASVYVNSKNPDKFTADDDDKNQERNLMVSTDSGETWNRARLPTITEDRFFSILDSSEGQIFLHVDSPGDTGRGTLYTSDAMGIVYSESLKDHLYPNYEDLTDFYRVQSMRGVYIASQLSSDDSVHTVITFDRGGEWQPIKRPEGAPCKDETKECYLQIHNLYSKSRGIKAEPPLSVPNAIGIILVHGHVADALQTTDPDVFVSSDGGYTWRLALTGPHHYQIADHGGLLVAVPSDTETPNVIKFSTDEGHCWVNFQYTNKSIVFTGLLIEPGNRDMTVTVWGYSQNDRIWHTFIFNFTKVIDRKCENKDYEDWVSHSHNDDQGCLLGSKETFRKLKADSWCFNGRVYEVLKTNESCACTPDDFDCDFGYKKVNEKCEKDNSVNEKEIDICFRGHEEKVVPVGYHKIPGDRCQGGFMPNEGKTVNLEVLCSSDYIPPNPASSLDNKKSQEKAKFYSSRTKAILIGLVAFFCLLVATVLVTYLAKKYQLLQRHKSTYRYSSIRADDCDDADHEILQKSRNTSLYEDSSDDDAPPQVIRTSQTRIINGHAVKSNGFIPAVHTSGTSKNTSNGNVKKARTDDSDEELLLE